eukprot:scaffold48461_cov38-Prasinocladus_malaysianus.AAC.1
MNMYARGKAAAKQLVPTSFRVNSFCGLVTCYVPIAFVLCIDSESPMILRYLATSANCTKSNRKHDHLLLQLYARPFKTTVVYKQ